MGHNPAPGRLHGDDGAVAVLVSLLLLFVLLPATALGLTSYTRSGVLAEQTRSADSGALTGAAALTLVNLAVVPPAPSLTVPPNSATLALSRACTATAKAAAVDNTLSTAFASPPLSPAVPCTATYTPETQFGPCVDAIFNALPPTPSITIPPIVIPAVPPLIPATTIGGGTASTGSIYGVVRNLIPGLLHNGVTVTVSYRVSGPLDALLQQTGDQPTSVSSEARRRFKALLPDLSAVNSQLSGPQAQLVGALQALVVQLQAVVGDGADANDVGDRLNEVLPGSPVPTVPVAPVVVLSGPCKAAAQSVLGDLADALQTNPDPTQDLLTCTQQIVLGLNPSFDPLNPPGGTVTVDPSCTDKVFRAELTGVTGRRVAGDRGTTAVETVLVLPRSAPADRRHAHLRAAPGLRRPRRPRRPRGAAHRHRAPPGRRLRQHGRRPHRRSTACSPSDLLGPPQSVTMTASHDQRLARSGRPRPARGHLRRPGRRPRCRPACRATRSRAPWAPSPRSPAPPLDGASEAARATTAWRRSSSASC